MLSGTISQKIDERRIRAELNFICSNLTRASILYLLIKSKNTEYCLSTEEISYRLGKNHRIILHHLEKLEEYGIVKIIRWSKNKKRRKIWGLEIEKAELIKEIYLYILKNFFTQAQLEKACSVYKKAR